jgi:5-deoxy-glucuronate isomerase
MMDYGILILNKNQAYSDIEKKEKAYILIKGKVIFEWGGNRVEAKRNSFLDENPICLHVPSDVVIKVTSLSDNSQCGPYSGIVPAWRHLCFAPAGSGTAAN